eukprot:c8785_g1_i3.p1 GENE.c8785_g1_i3~~c8785_g1_i3.p1  ORF type:complete len:104 (+),score=19.86 c8785_g1_i3:262-573(+)
MGLILFGLYLSANALVLWSREQAWVIGVVTQIVGWYMQIHPGHLIFEGRKPALMDSFFQSLVLAPLFVWYEILFQFGLFRSFKKEVYKRVGTRLRQLNQQKKQ